MMDDILEPVGIDYREGFWKVPPDALPYASWFDSVTNRGADNANLIVEHNYRIELYSEKIEKATEHRIEYELHRRSIPFEKTDYIWIPSESMYVLYYNFDYIEKRRV